MSLVMADEPCLPHLPFTASDVFLPNDSRSQQRVELHNTSPLVSSDPPFFSSDDDPAAENYSSSGGRLKRKFRGPWYNQQPHEVEMKRSKRTLVRKFDSAVWLSSDSMEGDEDAEFSSRLQLPEMSTNGRIASRPATVQSVEASSKEDTPEDRADKEILSCLEAGKEDIDLSSYGLTHLSNSSIKTLSTIVSIPMSSHGQSYHPLRPKLKFFLFNNSLRRVPGELFNLDNVVVLSLRCNLLVDLPSAIGKLRRLVELNVANNNLHFLPFEILQIFTGASRLHSLTWHPNPFYEPDVPDASLYQGTEPYPPDLRDGVLSRTGRPGAVASVLPENSYKWNIAYKFRSHVRFMNIDGLLAKGPQFPRDESLFSSSPRQCNTSYYPHHFGRSSLIPLAPVDDIPQPPRLANSEERSLKAPSLLEVALKKWSQSNDLPDLDEWLDSEPPERLTRVTQDAKLLRESEAETRNCTICKRRFVIPRTEWIEWWQISKVQQQNRSQYSMASPLRQMENRRDQVESMVPLIRRGCSWACLPEKDVDRKGAS